MTRRAIDPRGLGNGARVNGGAPACLVTGAAGFIGAHLVRRLRREGSRVIGVDDLSAGRMDRLDDLRHDPGFRFLERDLTRRGALADIEERVGCVVHLAASKIPRYGGAEQTLRINQQATERALEFARRSRAKFVFASTSDIYGRNPRLPFSEEDTDSVIGSSLSPRWAYAVSKLFGEHQVLAHQETHGLPVVILRYFGSYGPLQPLSWWGGPPPVFIDRVLRGAPVPVHGDGRQTRSFTYIDDVVEATFQATRRASAVGRIINVGSAEEVSILELAARIHALAGGRGEPQVDFVPYRTFSGKRYDDVMRRVPDNRLCGELLGVRSWTDLDTGLARTIAWQRTVSNGTDRENGAGREPASLSAQPARPAWNPR